jgi:hypothetical protein
MTDPISKNPDAERIVGLRDTGHGDAIIITAPAEEGYRCPVCKNEPYCKEHDFYDERLEWSEYNGFVYCRKCNKDFPSCICAVDIDKAIQVYLKTVEQAIEFHEGKKEKL